MKLIENIQELLLTFSIAILLPIIVYWGTSVFFKNPQYYDYVSEELSTKEPKQPEEEKELSKQIDNWQKERKPFENILFYTYFIVGVFTIILSNFINYHIISTAFTLGGIFNILMGLFYIPYTPLLNFITFILLFLTLIFLLLIKKDRNLKNI